MKTRLQEFIQDAKRRRIFEQESLAIEAAELIATLLKERQVNKAELAKRIGKSKAYVTQLLSGSRNMTLHTFADLAFALECKVELQALSLAGPNGGDRLQRGDSASKRPSPKGSTHMGRQDRNIYLGRNSHT
ncbi:MAG: helix-turn-helix transcriptional regulator [Bryobacteraceae bacterium]